MEEKNTLKKITIFTLVRLITSLAYSQTATVIKQSQLPKAAQDYIKKNLSGCTITNVAKMEDKGVLKYAAATNKASDQADPKK